MLVFLSNLYGGDDIKFSVLIKFVLKKIISHILGEDVVEGKRSLFSSFHI